MSGHAVAEGLWQAALGPTADEPPPPPNYDVEHAQEHDAFKPERWPPEGRGGPAGGVFWFRWWERRLGECAGSVEAARELGDIVQQDLVSGAMKAVAVHPHTGRSYPIPIEDWQATGDKGRDLRWSGVHWAGAEHDVPCDVYLIDPRPALAPAARKRPAAEARERNTDARIIYGLARIFMGDRVDAQGAIERVASELRAMGLEVSNGTISDRLSRGREDYDRARDTTRKS